MGKKASSSPTRILLLVGDRIGANCIAGGRKLSILDKFARYGWESTLAGVHRRVNPCPYAAKLGAQALEIDRLVDDIEDITAFDAISVLPGPSHGGLIESEAALEHVRKASAAGLIVSGWCHGVLVLAASGVIKGKQIVCHADDKATIELAGGTFVGHNHPPVTDGNLVTCARSYYYRAKNADAIKAAVTARAAALRT